MKGPAALLHLHELDLLLEEACEPETALRLRALGLGTPDPDRVARARVRVELEVDRRAGAAYARARDRYGRGLVVLRDRVCLGCHVTLPRSVVPEPGGFSTCESCGRLLWRR